MRGRSPRQTFRPHGGDFLDDDGFVQLCRSTVPSFFITIFYFGIAAPSQVLVFFPPIVRRFKCIDCFLLSHRVRDAVPRFGGPDVEEVTSYFQPCCFLFQYVFPSFLAVLSYCRVSSRRSCVLSFNFKPLFFRHSVESIQGFECFNGISVFSSFDESR